MRITIDRRKFCLYRHLLNGEVIYVGQGVASRPFELSTCNRGPLWNLAVGRTDIIEVEIVAWFDAQEDAIKAESADIALLQPRGNSIGTSHGTEHRKANRIARKDSDDRARARISAKRREAAADRERQSAKRKAGAAERRTREKSDPNFAKNFLKSYHDVWGD